MQPTRVYEVRPRKDKRGVDLISDAPPFGRLWYDTPDHAIGYAIHSRFGAASFGALDADRTSDRAGVVQEWQVRFKKHNSQDTSDRAFDNLGY